ncbi:MAG: alpha/beta hydrolase, partial [Cyanobacteriota bacterium]|nr:alpha/beta hydrolase [Cyanobacteriota bacterium]
WDVVQVINRLYPYMPSDLSHYIAEHGYRQKDGLEYIPEYDADMSRYIEEAGYAVEELWPFMENVSCPTMIVRGEESTFLSLDDAQNMCNAIPKAVLKEIPKSSHMPLLENRDAFIKVIIDFLEGL